MFVTHEQRGRGVGKRMLEQALAYARTCCEEVLLTVVGGNDAAHNLYASAGFEVYGHEPCAIKLGTDYHSEVLMRLPLTSS